MWASSKNPTIHREGRAGRQPLKLTDAYSKVENFKLWHGVWRTLVIETKNSNCCVPLSSKGNFYRVWKNVEKWSYC